MALNLAVPTVQFHPLLKVAGAHRLYLAVMAALHRFPLTDKPRALKQHGADEYQRSDCHSPSPRPASRAALAAWVLSHARKRLRAMPSRTTARSGLPLAMSHSASARSS
jgi:hypothetical protein